MTPQDKTDNAPLRQRIASRILMLRANKQVWCQGAPRADLRCRRDWNDVELASVHGQCSLGELVDAAVCRGRHDFEAIAVRSEERPMPYEDYTVTFTVLTTSEKLADAAFAKQIDMLWQQYQVALHRAADREADYATFLRLKDVFEPGR